MAKRGEVDLVIRAKETAVKAIDAVSAAINEFSAAQADLPKDAAKTDTALTRLGTVFDKLEKSLGGANVGRKLEESFTAATSASNRLGKSLSENQNKLDDFLISSLQASEATERLRARSVEAAAAVEKEAAALAKSKAAAKDSASALATASSERARLVVEEKKLAEQIVTQQARVTAATEVLAKRSALLSSSVKPTKQLQESFEAAGRVVAETSARLADLEQTYNIVAGTIPKADAAVTRFERSVIETTAAVAKQEAALADAREGFAAQTAMATAAATQQRKLNQSANEAAAALAANKGQIASATEELSRLDVAAANAQVGLGQLAERVRGPLLKSFGEVRQATQTAKQAWDGMEGVVRRLAEGMAVVGPPTREQALAWNAATVASKAAKAEFITQRDVLQKLRGILREEATDVDGLRIQFEKFSTALAEGSTRLDSIQREATQTAAAFEKLAGSAQRATTQTRRVSEPSNMPRAEPVNALATAFRNLYGESRTAMSLTQRWRGEVLSLVAAYGGIYGVINLLGQVIETYKTLEAVQSRLNVVFDGDQGKSAETMDFLRRTADRLGQSLGVLGDEYSKFTVATKGTNLEGEKTRKIFLAVAEAARVNKISNDDLKGVFTALSQIASKGVVQMEELRQQLGDRLTGAVQIMAAGLGVGTDELFDMTKAGEVTSEALVNFADELNKRFGPALAASLLTTTTQLGALQNSTFQVMKTFGEAGFIEAFTDLLKQLNETLRSSDFEAFVRRASAATAALTNVLTFLVKNFQGVSAALALLVSIRVAPFFIALSTSLLSVTGLLPLLRSGIAGSVIAVDGLARSMPIAASAAGRLTLAFRALLSSTGLGLLITAISVGIALWSTRADAAAEAMNAHRKVVDQVKNSYDKAGKSAAAWAKEIQKISLTEAISRMVAFRQELENIRLSAKAPVDAFGTLGDNSTLADVQNLVRMFQKGEIVAADFRQQIDELAQQDPKFSRELAISFIQIADKAGDAEDRIEEATALIALAKDPTDELALAVLRGAGAFEKTGDETEEGTKKLEAYIDAIKRLGEAIPSLEPRLKFLEDLGKVLTAVGDAFANASSLSDVFRASSLGAQAITATLSADQIAIFKDIAGNTKVTQEMFAKIVAAEGYVGNKFQATAYADAGGKPTIGYGSTIINGRDVRMGDVITAQEAMAQAVKDLDSLITQIDALVKKPLSKAQLEALTSYAYNVGIGSFAKSNILKTLNEGDYAGAATALRNGVATVKGVPNAALRARRGREADQFTAGIDDPKIQAELLETEQKRAEEKAKFNDELTKSNEQAKFELGIAKETLVQQEVAKALRAAELKAKEQDLVLTQAQRAEIIATTTATYAKASAEKVVEDQRKAAQESEQKVNDLLAQRAALEERVKVYTANGDTTAAEAARLSIEGINTQLIAAIDNAIKMWEAIGGTGAAAAIEQLKNARLNAKGLTDDAKTVIVDWKRVGEMFASGITNAFVKFGNAIAEGKSATEAFRESFLQFAADFLQQIGQMILQALVLKAVNAVIGAVTGVPIAVKHGGGMVGMSGGRTRMVSPMAFAVAPRMHGGGLPGLGPDEVATILEKDEEVLSKESPRNILNGGAAASPSAPASGGPGYIQNILAVGDDEIALAMSGRAGSNVILNHLKANAPALRKMLGL